jgi:hypothetical protein
VDAVEIVSDRPSEVLARFDAGCPWFDHGQWGWAYDARYSGESRFYRLAGINGEARGSIEIYMPGSTREQVEAASQWLRREFNPAAEVPATRFALKFAMRPVGNDGDMPIGNHPLGNILGPRKRQPATR